MTDPLSAVCDDLAAEHADLERIAGLDDEQWDLDTPAEGWLERDEISHLWFFGERAGVRARPFSDAIRGMALPDAEPGVELTAPSGDVWVWGPEGAPTSCAATRSTSAWS